MGPDNERPRLQLLPSSSHKRGRSETPWRWVSSQSQADARTLHRQRARPKPTPPNKTQEGTGHTQGTRHRTQGTHRAQGTWIHGVQSIEHRVQGIQGTEHSSHGYSAQCTEHRVLVCGPGYSVTARAHRSPRTPWWLHRPGSYPRGGRRGAAGSDGAGAADGRRRGSTA